MPITYPAAAPTISGDFLTISRFLNSPALVQRRLRTLAENRFISDVLLQGRTPPSGGAVLVEISEGIFADSNAAAVEPGGEFPISTVSTGTASLFAVKKRGIDTFVTDEAIRRQGFNPVDRAFTKLTNEVVRRFDVVAMTAINAAITQTAAAAAVWSTSTTLLREIAVAKATIVSLNMGYDPNTLVCSDLAAAYLTTNATALGALPRESRNDNPIVVKGLLSEVLGLDILVTPNLPTATEAWVCDRTQLGGIADEEGLTSKSIRDEERERWRLRAKRTGVAYVQEPGAIYEITGVTA